MIIHLDQTKAGANIKLHLHICQEFDATTSDSIEREKNFIWKLQRSKMSSKDPDQTFGFQAKFEIKSVGAKKKSSTNN